MTEPRQTYCVVVIETLDNDNEIVRTLSRERYIATSIGAALDEHAPDPAPGVSWSVKYEGRGRAVFTTE
jgi:hypothetical protein